MAVNISNITNIEGFMDVVTITNNNAGGMLGVFILIIIFGVAWLGAMGYGRDSKESFYGATLISSFMALFLWSFTLLPNSVTIIFFVGAAIVLSFSFFQR